MALTNDDLQAIATLLQPINNRLEHVENKLNYVEDKLNYVDNRLDKIESDVSALKAGQLELTKEAGEIKHKVNDTYTLALDAWGQSTENRVLLESSQLA